MQVKAIALCVLIAAGLNIHLSAAEKAGVPKGWVASEAVGKYYEVGFDTDTDATYLRAIGAGSKALGAISQTVDATPYKLAMVTLTAEVKASPAVKAGSAEIYFRFQGKKGDAKSSSSTSNKFNVNTTAWQPVQLKMLKDADSKFDTLDFGLILQGTGEVWVRNLKLETTPAEQDKSPEVSTQPLHANLPIGAVSPAAENLGLRP